MNTTPCDLILDRPIARFGGLFFARDFPHGVCTPRSVRPRRGRDSSLTERECGRESQQRRVSECRNQSNQSNSRGVTRVTNGKVLILDGCRGRFSLYYYYYLFKKIKKHTHTQICSRGITHIHITQHLHVGVVVNVGGRLDEYSPKQRYFVSFASA
jgi:hypothetical protein